jgi:hypothetical protein
MDLANSGRLFARTDILVSGIALPIEGTLLSLIFGQGRLSLLHVNFIAFAILQVFVFYVARFVWGGRTYGYLALGLTLCQVTAWFWGGGLLDFRMDFVAYCLFGIWVCAVLRSSLFMSIRWAFAAGLIAAFLVLHRFLTIVYLLGVSVGFAAICVGIAFLLRRDTDLVVRCKHRLFNMGLSLGTLLIVTTPILNWKAICDYYVAAHVFSNEKNVRATQVGIHDLAGHLFFYPRSILVDHLGSIFLWASGVAIAGGAAARLLDRSRENESFAQDGERALLESIFLLCSIVVPVVVLTADIAKSPIVGGIVGVPAALLTTVLVVCLAANGPNQHSLGRKLVFVCSLLVLALARIFHHRGEKVAKSFI